MLAKTRSAGALCVAKCDTATQRHGDNSRQLAERCISRTVKGSMSRLKRLRLGNHKGWQFQNNFRPQKQLHNFDLVIYLHIINIPTNLSDEV